MNLEDFLPIYPEINNDNFYQKIYTKKEFFENMLEKEEKIPEKSGVLMKHQKLISNFVSSNTLYNEILLVHEMGCLNPETKVVTWNGKFKKARNVKEGDTLIGDDGEKRLVTACIEGKSEMYKIKQKNGIDYIVNKKHILTLFLNNDAKLSEEEWKKLCKKSDIRCSNFVEITVENYLKLSKDTQKELYGIKGQDVNWKFKHVVLPYIYGTNLKNDVNIDYVKNSIAVRREFLSGILDSRGVLSKNKKYISIFVPENIQDIILLLTRSLGIFSEKIFNEIRLFIPKNILNKLSLANIELKSHTCDKTNFYKIKVCSIGEGVYVGWELDFKTNKRFLLEDFTITHNTGKTCSSIGATEKIRKQGGYKGALYIASSQSLINNFINELLFKCTDGLYIPEDYESLTEREKAIRINKSISRFYKTETFEVFAKHIKKYKSTNYINSNYDNHVIIIDEVHNLRQYVKEKTLNIYNEFWSFLHTVKNCKIILLSGTPMKNGVEEISSIMNLILPLNSQLETGKKFLNKYFDKQNDNLFYIKNSHINELKQKFKGRVSYLKSMTSFVKRSFIGEKLGQLKHFKVTQDTMSDFQSTQYAKSYKEDTSKNKDSNEESDEKKSAFYINSRQASLFVFPDGSWGQEGFKKYIVKENKKGIKDVKKTVYSMTSELRRKLKGQTDEETLNNLRKYSSKYFASIKLILDSVGKKSIFVYNEFVTGSGLILFSLILKLFNFKPAGINETTKEKRYILLTSELENIKLKKLIERFNKPDNMKGEYIHVILGSRKISEGYSFKNIQIEDVQTPWFNYSETSQVLARGYRLGSHNDLYKNGINPTLNIYQRVSFPNNKLDSIDLIMYEFSEDKDISIKSVERLLKESSWDCQLVKKRNLLLGYDNERECEYMNCDYKCDGIENTSDISIDFSTYNIFYFEEYYPMIFSEIKLLFREIFSISIQELFKILYKFDQHSIIKSLLFIIDNNIEIINKYGFTCYLREDKNIIFLIDNIKVKAVILSDYYIRNPHIHTEKTFDEIIEKTNEKYNKNLLKKMSKSNITKNQFSDLINNFSIDEQQFLLENSLLAYSQNIESKIRDITMEHFKEKYKKIENVWYSFFNKQTRCLKEGKWEDCTFEETKSGDTEKIINNKYGYYGLYNDVDKKYCIREIIETDIGAKHKQTTGKNCNSWTKEATVELLLKLKIKLPTSSTRIPKIVYNIFNFDIDSVFNKGIQVGNNSLEKIKEDKKKFIKLLNEKDKKILKNIPKELVKKFVFLYKQNKQFLCLMSCIFFAENDLLIADLKCGSFGKKKN